MKNRTKLERRLIIMLVVLVTMLLSGYIVIAGYYIMEIGETIKVVCPHPVLSGPYTGSYQGQSFGYWKVFCDVITTQ